LAAWLAQIVETRLRKLDHLVFHTSQLATKLPKLTISTTSYLFKIDVKEYFLKPPHDYIVNNVI